MVTACRVWIGDSQTYNCSDTDSQTAIFDHSWVSQKNEDLTVNTMMKKLTNLYYIITVSFFTNGFCYV